MWTKTHFKLTETYLFIWIWNRVFTVFSNSRNSRILVLKILPNLFLKRMVPYTQDRCIPHWLSFTETDTSIFSSLSFYLHNITSPPTIVIPWPIISLELSLSVLPPDFPFQTGTFMVSCDYKTKHFLRFLALMQVV